MTKIGFFQTLLLAGFAWSAGTGCAFAAGFDGKWVADIPAQDRCNATSTMTLLVADGVIAGQIHNPANVVPVRGKVEADGSATFTAQGHFPGTMRFSGDHFEATWFNGACDRHAEGDREPSSEQQAALMTQRKQSQDQFADLVRRAEAGDRAVDYTALRLAYVHSENWDFYDSKSTGLMQQAVAAQKGGDCTTALADLDQIIALDFTIAAAHRLRADCLEDRGRAHVESAIADGLTASLTDSGDGDSEKTAYVVVSRDEENAILIRHQFQLRAKQTEIRGGDGRYYDTIQAVGLTNGVVRQRTVYFDVSNFAKGRQSRRVAIDQTAAAIH